MYRELMAKPPEAPILVGSAMLVVAVLDAFLDWVSKNCESRTYEWYRKRLQLFAKSIPEGQPVTALKQ